MKLKTIQIRFAVLLLIGIFSLSIQLKAQVTIGAGVAPDENALLDLKEGDNQPSTKGLLLPRVELKALADSYPLKSHVKGMFVYNLEDIDDNIYPGCYYNTGTEWARVGAGATVTPEVSLNNLWNADAGWLIQDQEFRSYGKTANFIIKLQRTGTTINVWNTTNNPMLLAKIPDPTNKTAYKPVCTMITNTTDVTINCLVNFPEREISTTAESQIDLAGNIYLLNVKESIGTIMNRGTIQTGDAIVISGSYFIK